MCGTTDVSVHQHVCMKVLCCCQQEIAHAPQLRDPEMAIIILRRITDVLYLWVAVVVVVVSVMVVD